MSSSDRPSHNAETATRGFVATLARRSRRRPVRIVTDLSLLVAFVVTFATHEPGFDPDYVLHSWSGLALVPFVAVHLGSNAGWIARLWRNKRRDRQARLGLLNTIFGTATAICTLSGLPLWLDWSTAVTLSTVHAVTGYTAVVAMLGHLLMNRRRIRSLVRGAAT